MLLLAGLLLALSLSIDLDRYTYTCLTWSKRLIFIVYYHLHTKCLASESCFSLSLSLSFFFVHRTLSLRRGLPSFTDISRTGFLSWRWTAGRIDWSFRNVYISRFFAYLLLMRWHSWNSIPFSLLCYHRLKNNNSYRLIDLFIYKNDNEEVRTGIPLSWLRYLGIRHECSFANDLQSRERERERDDSVMIVWLAHREYAASRTMRWIELTNSEWEAWSITPLKGLE